MGNNLKLSIPKGCDNAPRKKILKDFMVATVTKDTAFLRENISDQITWNIVGQEVVEGEEAFFKRMDELHEGTISELTILDIITHGYVASAHGTVIGTNQSYDFNHVFRFTGATKTAKIKTITSYLIPRDE